MKTEETNNPIHIWAGLDPATAQLTLAERIRVAESVRVAMNAEVDALIDQKANQRANELEYIEEETQ